MLAATLTAALGFSPGVTRLPNGFAGTALSQHALTPVASRSAASSGLESVLAPLLEQHEGDLLLKCALDLARLAPLHETNYNFPDTAQVLPHVSHASFGEGAKALDYRHHLLSRLGEILHVDVVALGAGREPARRMPQSYATLRFDRHGQWRVAGHRDLWLRRQQEMEHPVANVS